MARRTRSRKGKNDTLILGAGLAAIALIALAGKGQNGTATPSIIVNPPSVSIPAFDFILPDSPALPAFGDTVNNLYGLNPPSIDTPPAINALSSLSDAASGIKYPGDSNIDFSSVFPKSSGENIDLPPAGIVPFLFGGGKVGVLESINESIFAGGKEFIKTSNPEVAIAGVTATQALGLDLAKTGANVINKAGTLETGLAGPLAKGGAIGAGTVIGAAGLGITGYTALASASAFKEQNTTSSAAAFGASAGLLGYEGLSLAGAFAGPAAGATGLAGLAVGGAFLGAGLVGVGLGLGANQVLIDLGIQKPSAVPSGPIKPAPSESAGIFDSSPQEANIYDETTGMGSVQKSASKGKKQTVTFQQAPAGTSGAQLIQTLKFNQAVANIKNSYSAPAQSVFAGSFFK